MEIYDATEILEREAEKYKSISPPKNTEQCRLCLKVIKNRIIITNAIRKKFLDVTQTELPTTDKLSKYVCPKCDKGLKDASAYRENLIEIQKKLWAEVEIPIIFVPEFVQLKEERDEKMIIEEKYANDNDFLYEDDIRNKEESIDSKSEKLKEDNKEISKTDPKIKPEARIIEENFDNDNDFWGGDDYSDDDDDDDDGDYFGDRNDTKKDIKAEQPTEDNKEISKTDDKTQPEKRIRFRSRPKRGKKEQKGRRKRNFDYPDPELDKEVQESKVKETNGRSYYLCSHCGKNISTRFALKEHILTKHRDLEKKFKCDYEGCGLLYVTENRLNLHRQLHRNKKELICPTCGKISTTKNRLREHIMSVHEKVKKYFCDLCDYSGISKSRLAAHVQSHIEKVHRRNYPCHICGLVSVCPKYIKRHIIAVHEGGGKSGSGGGRGRGRKEQEFTCHCGKTYNYRAAYTMHIKTTHLKIKNQVCSICGHAFSHKLDLNNHILVKHNPEKIVKNIPCDICGKLFGIAKQLDRHRLYHFVKYECKVEGCDEYFNTVKRLERHVKKNH